MGAKLNMDASEALTNRNAPNDEDEEDVVFEQSYASTSAADKNKHKKSNGKKSNDYVKEYKEIV